MIELIKEAGSVLKELPDIAVYILVGILFYKIAILGSIFGIVKLAINKTHDLLTRPKEVTHRYCLGDYLLDDAAKARFEDLLSEMHKRTNSSFKYLYESDFDFAIRAFREKIEREDGKF